MAISEQWPELLEPGLRAIFFKQTAALAGTAKAPMLFDINPSDKAEEHDLAVGGFRDWGEYTGIIEYDNNYQGFKTTYTPKEFVDGFKVERKLIHDDLYNIINKRPFGLATAGMRKREKDAANIFNNAFTASGESLGADSQSLCDGAHPHSPANLTSTQNNSGTSALSKESIIATHKLMELFTDDRGELITVVPDTLLVPKNLEPDAWLEANNPMETDSADRNESFVNSLGLKIIPWHYLTDDNNWWLIDSTLMKQHLNWFDLEPMEFVMDPASDFNLEAKFRGYMRYSLGWSDWPWIFGHEVA